MPGTPSEHLIFTKKEWSKPPFSEILDSLPPVKVVYDIGANAGGFSEVIHQKFPEAKIFCWEPVRANYEFLLNSVPYATCYQRGIYYGETSSRVGTTGGNVGAYFVEYTRPKTDNSYTGEVIQLETLETHIPKPDLIKLDVEGAEANIISNSTTVQDCPHLIIEWHLDNPLTFFAKFLPTHVIKINISNTQFYLTKI